MVLCQLGLQFFPDRPAALAEMRRVLAAGGRLGLTVYGPIERNPAPDGGPLEYRVVHTAKLWKPGERPKLEQRVLEGDPKLSI